MVPLAQDVVQAHRVGGAGPGEARAVGCPVAGPRAPALAGRVHGRASPVADEELGLAHHHRRRVVGVVLHALDGVPHGAADDFLADGPALGVVAGEQAGVGRARAGQGELPGQVPGVLDAGVHSLGAGRRVDVGGVPGDEDPAVAVAVHDPVADAEHRGPADVEGGGRLR